MGRGTTTVRDPARDAAAESRARELLRSVAGDELADMYERHGFLTVDGGGEGYGYLIYPAPAGGPLRRRDG